MAGIEIIGTGYAVNGATVSQYETLYNLLAPFTGPGYVIINGYGEALANGRTRTWTAQQVGQWVAAGNHWIDWCGWPMYYQGTLVHRLGPQGQVEVSLQAPTIGPAGWRAFSQAVGQGSLGGASFFAQATHGYELNRGWPTTLGRAPTVVWPSSLTYKDYEGTWPVVANGRTALMALHHPSGGTYCYIAHNVGVAQVTVPPATAGAWIRTQLPSAQRVTSPTNPSALPNVSWAGAAGTVTTATSGARVTWSFALPRGWRWNQHWDTAPTAPAFTTSGGYLPVAGLAPGAHQVVLGFWDSTGALVGTKQSPTVTIIASSSSGTGQTPPAPTCPSGYSLVNGVCIPTTSSTGTGTIPSPATSPPTIPWVEVGLGAVALTGLALVVAGLGHGGAR